MFNRKWQFNDVLREGDPCVPVRIALVMVVVTFSPNKEALSDVYLFENGQEVEYRARLEDDRIHFELAGKTYAFPARSVEKRPSDPPLETQWNEMVSKNDQLSPAERLELAKWAFKHGMTERGKSILLKGADPSQLDRQWHLVVQRLKELQTPLDHARPELLLAKLPGEFQLKTSTHLTLIHQATPQEAKSLIIALENVFLAFYFEFQDLGFDLKLPREKLILVWINEHSDYRNVIKNVAGTNATRTQGYFHPTQKVVYFFDDRTRSQSVARRTALAKRTTELKQLETFVENAPKRGRFQFEQPDRRHKELNRAQARQLLESTQTSIDQATFLLELDRLERNLTTAAHELIHQLVLISGLAPQLDTFPLWLHEGLAMQFEGVRGDQWVGLTHPNHRRLAAWSKQEFLPPLNMVINDSLLKKGYSDEAYAQAWSLVHFLLASRRTEFQAYLDLLRAPGFPTRHASDRFRDAFHIQSDLKFQQAWSQFMQAKTSQHASMPE